MAQRILTPPSSPLFQDTELGSVIRDSGPLLMEVLNEERELVIVDNNTREVRDADFEQALTTVAANISIISEQDIGRSHDNFGDNDNSEHLSEEDGNVDQQFDFCKNCTKYKRVQTHDQLKRGDSIRFPRIEGLYYHHAIVKEVQNGPNSSGCTLTLIHLQKVGLPLLSQVIEETKTYDLKKEIVEKVIYKSNRFTPDEIIQRAEKYAAENRIPRVYNIIENCEKLSNEFAQGVKISHQVHSKSQQLISGLCWILNVFCKIGSRIRRIRGIALFASIVSLTDIIQKIIQLKKFFRDKIVCFCCYDKEHKKLKISLVLGLISLAVSAISHFNWSTLTISLIISIALPLVVPHMYEYIMPLIQPSFLIPKLNLGIQNIPRAGDIITFDYQNLPHEGVVSYVHGIGSDTTRFKATIIHFPWPGLFGTYTVSEDTIYFNKTDDVSFLDFERTHHYRASDVVKRAKEQLGQRHHNHFTYRSSHLSRYCKVSYVYGCKKKRKYRHNLHQACS